MHTKHPEVVYEITSKVENKSKFEHMNSEMSLQQKYQNRKGKYANVTPVILDSFIIDVNFEQP